MIARPETPRIPPLPADQRSSAAQQLLNTVIVGGGEANIFTTLVRAEGLARRWLPFGGKLLNGKVPARDRELLILRTAWNCQAEYEWAQHVGIAMAAGLDHAEIEQVPGGPDGFGDAWDALLLRAADELHTDRCLSAPTWARLAERYDTEQLIELPMLVGHYEMLAMVLNSLGVPIDDGLPGFPAA